MWKVGNRIQCFRLTTNQTFTLVIELYNKDLLIYYKTGISIQGSSSITIEGHNTQKYQYQYNTGNFLYYKDFSSIQKSGIAPVFVYFTVKCENQGSDLDKYPQIFKDNIYIVSYGLDGITDHVDSYLYDYHRSYEIDKTQMKMLVPLNLNGNKLTNVSLDTNYNNSVATVEYVKDLEAKLYPYTNNHVCREMFDIVIDFKMLAHMN